MPIETFATIKRLLTGKEKTKKKKAKEKKKNKRREEEEGRGEDKHEERVINFYFSFFFFLLYRRSVSWDPPSLVQALGGDAKNPKSMVMLSQILKVITSSPTFSLLLLPPPLLLPILLPPLSLSFFANEFIRKSEINYYNESWR